MPVPVDVSETDYNLDPQAVEAAIGPRTRFLLPVHLYGQLADMRALLALADRHELSVARGRLPGARGDPRRAPRRRGGPRRRLQLLSGQEPRRIRRRRRARHERRAAREHRPRAARARPAREVHARARRIHGPPRHDPGDRAFAQAAALDGWNDERRQQAAFYNEALAGVGDLVLPPVAAGSRPVWHLYPIRTADPSASPTSCASAGSARAATIPSRRTSPRPIAGSASPPGASR